jgi:hypothetical protein
MYLIISQEETMETTIEVQVRNMTIQELIDAGHAKLARQKAEAEENARLGAERNARERAEAKEKVLQAARAFVPAVLYPYLGTDYDNYGLWARVAIDVPGLAPMQLALTRANAAGPWKAREGCGFRVAEASTTDAHHFGHNPWPDPRYSASYRFLDSDRDWGYADIAVALAHAQMNADSLAAQLAEAERKNAEWRVEMEREKKEAALAEEALTAPEPVEVETVSLCDLYNAAREVLAFADSAGCVRSDNAPIVRLRELLAGPMPEPTPAEILTDAIGEFVDARTREWFENNHSCCGA